jgi:hypothetical protein
VLRLLAEGIGLGVREDVDAMVQLDRAKFAARVARQSRVPRRMRLRARTRWPTVKRAATGTSRLSGLPVATISATALAISAAVALGEPGAGFPIGYDPGQHAAYAASWIQILENQPLEIFRAAADGEKIHTYLQTFQQQQSVSREEPQVDKSEIIKEYDRLVDGPAARQWLEKERPSLVAARDQAIVELRREKLQKETAEKPHRVARVRR